jgi:hypothetical protein
MGSGTVQAQESPVDADLSAEPAKPRPLTVTSAVEQYTETMAAIEVLGDLCDTAKEWLIEHGKSTGRRTFLDRIAMERTGGARVFDQAQAKLDLEAAGLPIPKKSSKLGWTLKVLKFGED